MMYMYHEILVEKKYTEEGGVNWIWYFLVDKIEFIDRFKIRKRERERGR